jgi:glycerophosphoryl diester phosphodiesterase
MIAISHRGDPVGYCENTLPAFASSVRLGVERIPTFRQVLDAGALDRSLFVTGNVKALRTVLE